MQLTARHAIKYRNRINRVYEPMGQENTAEKKGR